MQAPNTQIPPQGSQPPFQPPGTGSPPQPRPSQPRQPWSSPCHPCPLPYHGPGSALATPAPSPTAPAASPPATARVAKNFAGFIIDQLLPLLYSQFVLARRIVLLSCETKQFSSAEQPSIPARGSVS